MTRDTLPPYHYAGPDAIRPLNPVPVPVVKLSAVAAARRVAHLKWQVDRLDDQRQIEILQRTYGYYVDKNLWKQIADLFTDDGTLEIGGRGVFVGKSRVLQYLQWLGKPQDGRLYDHTQIQPIVDVSPDGTVAKGRWRALVFGGDLNRASIIGDCIYENEYRKENGVWKISRLHAYFEMYSTLEQGWAEYAMPNTHPEKALPPDLPPTRVYDMYPGTLVAPMHYENPVTGKPVYPLPRNAGAAGAADAADLPDELAVLARRLTRLQDIQEIENLQNAYGFYLDKWQWDSATALFADQGTIELAQRGVYVGRAHIRASLEDAFGPQGLHQGEVNDHAFYQPVIHVADDGRTANARVRELSLLGKYGVDAYIAGGTRENQYVKENGVWRIKADHLYLTFLADYAKGWAHGALPAPGPSKTLPPDRPPSVDYKPFPAFQELPFHYPNPVTGKWVQGAELH